MIALHSSRRRAALVLGAALLCLSGLARGADPLATVRGLEHASLLLVEPDGTTAIAQGATTPRVPASTMKLLTAYAALETWGREHRFHTDVRLDDDGVLWVVGHGDPYLVSEELMRIATALRARGLTRINGLGLDTHALGADTEIPGRSRTSNPYDAPLSALAANFNTVSLIREADGRLRSGEPQTPLTATAQALGADLGPGRHRVNLIDRARAERHFGELFAALLERAGVSVTGPIRQARAPRGARLVYRHHNSRTLAEMIAPMLEYSTNFIANGLFIMLSDPKDKGVAGMAEARRAVTRLARDRLGWRDAVIDDGAGLSRANRLSARQLVELLDAFTPYRDLMPRQDDDPRVLAKTGTLTGVSSYAGYVRRNGGWGRFALLVEQPVDRSLRQRLASALAR
ncbi:D-alanyl-D-alanine carboxypeptidase/D-alanyl-D-alanine-endopeptidase [Marichromatium sp. AB32]|uniref:D-alanyl-D-alanine carboxypeptidase/D-alanyl-D-alanine-endopeptidase n=1 Tax=Marichromatium sp. AB32 TaxID=2483363 RepID=UPI000F3D10E5|nr:D-alanyl-D-alanine carboxypeptidase [Marichromatium sp. AB32]MBO8087399.1 D-alanyl-D-alanine carboxypeptidase [Marichromatium sp.]RNE92974.1 peptidase S13 [Marichromatium sp. AB32]